MARKKRTTLKEQYKKEIKRLIKGSRKYFPGSGVQVVSSAFELEPKRVTKEKLARIKKVKPKYFFQRLRFVAEDTGEVISGERLTDIRKVRGAERFKNEAYETPPYYDDTVLSEVYRRIQENYSKLGARMLSRLLEKVIGREGMENVAHRLQEERTDSLYYTDIIVETSNQEVISTYMAMFANIILGEHAEKETGKEMDDMNNEWTEEEDSPFE